MSEQTQDRIFSALASHAASAFEGMTGERPTVEVRPAGAPEQAALIRRQTFSRMPGSVWIAASEADACAGGGWILEAAGVGQADAEKAKAEFLEIIQQTIAGLARQFSEWTGTEIQPETSDTGGIPPADVFWTQIEVRQGDARTAFTAGVEPALNSAFEIRKARQVSPSFDLLLDVELPISISFGRAQVPLKDVLKLTTGSIVELDRGISDAVDVIVNDCVIARGEVVTVDGNFGVRIQEVISRQERWRTVS